MKINDLTYEIIMAAMSVHRELGPGLLESVYHSCMVIELRELGLGIKSELVLPISYRGYQLDGEAFRTDLLVEDFVIVELKSVEQILGVHKKQLLTYLRLARKPLGLLINFNEAVLKDGIYRVVNGQLPKA